MENINISRWQFYLLVFQVVLGTSYFFMPNGMIALLKQDAWLAPLWCGFVGILMAVLWLYLARLYPNLSIIQISMNTFGKFIGWIVSLLYIWFFISSASWVAGNANNFMNITLMPRTPTWIFGVIFLLIATYAAAKGFEVIARTCEFVVPIMYCVFIFLCVFMLKEWDWMQFKPAFNASIWEIMNKSKVMVGFPFMEMVCFSMIFPYITKKRGSTFITGIVTASLFLSGIIFFSIGVLGISRASHLTYPLYSMAMELEVSEFLEHMEAVIAMVFLLSIFTKLCVFFYCAVLGISQLFQVQDRKLIGLPLVLLISALSGSFHKNIIENIEWTKRYSIYNQSLFAVTIPVLLILMTWIKKWVSSVKEKSYD